MYTEQDYLYGWVFYLLGVALVMLCGWILTVRIKWPVIRHLLRLTVASILLVPWYASNELDYLAPAWLIAVFEGVFEGGEAFWRAGSAVVGAVILVWVVYAVAATGAWYVRRNTTAQE